ncbi:MAG: PLP-dependent aminotransferase family protein [Thermoplasmata archaeon]|nr:PLP-dependent aminotransferase family protein [Thermoplasmata archaeon]
MKPVFDDLYSDRASGMRASEIRELLKLTQRPDIISFAGGLPNPLAFPLGIIKELTQKVLDRYGEKALQYGTTEGLTSLREAFAENYNAHDIPCTPDEITIVGGSQQGLDLLSKIFLNPGDEVVVGDPTYLGGLAAFRAFQARFVAVPLDNDGMRVDLLEERLEKMRREGRKPKMVYVIPTFQNPTGTTLPTDRRKRLIDLVHEYDTVLVEDNPYGRLRYEGEPLKPIKYYDDPDDPRVIYLGTLSKTLVPGFRIATVVAPPEITRKLVIAKQSTDLCSTTFTQYIAAEYISGGYLDAHMRKIKTLYGGKRNIMLKAMDEFMPDGVEWTRPEGGMFLWTTLPEGCNTVEMFPKAVENKVAYVVGKAFYAYEGGERSMRINFSYPTDEQIMVGIERLAKVIEEEIKDKKAG